MSDPDAAIAWLRSPQAIRERCALILAAAEADRLDNFALDLDRLDDVAAYVVTVIRDSYPDLNIPYHSRWRHFGVGGKDRWAALVDRVNGLSADEIARVRFDLVVTSVLLDAGAGGRWRYREPGTDDVYTRSEGLAVASFHLFADGGFSARPDAPLRADAEALASLSETSLVDAFQAGPDNPLVGLAGRAKLLHGLAEALAAAPHLFGARDPRIGALFDHLAARAQNGALPAADILEAVLEGFGPIWPGRIDLHGVNLGDVWKHPAATCDGPTNRLVPFHKLSQWLTYSLVEPLEDAGIIVTDLDELTGLPEYRNGGLLIDLGLLRPKHEAVMRERHAVGSEIVVEWRALTVALLDRVADRVRAILDLDATSLPLAKVLEGGTWSAGRRIAKECRPDGGPPITVVSDGTVF